MYSPEGKKEKGIPPLWSSKKPITTFKSQNVSGKIKMRDFAYLSYTPKSIMLMKTGERQIVTHK